MSRNAKNTDNKTRRCLYCGNQASIIWVHGHGQCAACGINVEECCRGEQCVNMPLEKKSPLIKGE